ncbi:hypothetical protein HHL19_35390 [Streptomyces sp. R302]|uniref:hypothetical protein n=1 Tax=unclassified Streptomyces TaxID=2593676 RepID=UPI00145CF17D|nr:MULTISPECIES: hypothetical protein [unclassified Streptomyces]NML55174.1 hypothetical protein [Streptomyces sp. R301]NML83796.1 hypothetical protein [Streptomyces sp. R302]
MAGTTRTRKTTTAAETAPPAATPDTATDAAPLTPAEPAAEEDTAAADTPVPPDAAPLEPPVTHEAPPAPAAPLYAHPTEVIPDDAHLADVILDDATGLPPADIDAVFRQLTEYGSILICTVRLVESTYLGPHSTPVHRLLQPAGAHVSESIAARIRERLVAQAACVAAAADQQGAE